jgi:hypothetical protein
LVDLVKSAIALSIAEIRWGKISADGMNVAKIAAAPMLRSSSRRPDFSAGDPPSTRIAIIVGASDLTSSVRTSTKTIKNQQDIDG